SSPAWCARIERCCLRPGTIKSACIRDRSSTDKSLTAGCEGLIRSRFAEAVAGLVSIGSGSRRGPPPERAQAAARRRTLGHHGNAVEAEATPTSFRPFVSRPGCRPRGAPARRVVAQTLQCPLCEDRRRRRRKPGEYPSRGGLHRLRRRHPTL